MARRTSACVLDHETVPTPPSISACARRAVCALAVSIVAVAHVPGTATADDRAVFEWPLHPQPVVTEPFAPPAHDWLRGHRGVDLGASAGETVYAAGDGVVVFAGQVAGRPVVSVEHDGEIRTTYEPVEPRVARGERVRRGDVIGAVQAGHPGCSAQACLHWGARSDGVYLDPVGLVSRRPIVLLPVVP